MNLRKVSIDDIELLIKLRIDYLIEDRGSVSPEDSEKIEAQLRYYFPKHIASNTFIGVIAENDNEVMGAAYLAVDEMPANPSFITGKRGTLLNVLTYPPYRRQGIATKVISKVIDEAKLCGVSSISLSATSAGKPLYEKLGFQQPESNYTAMNLKLV